MKNQTNRSWRRTEASHLLSLLGCKRLSVCFTVWAGRQHQPPLVLLLRPQRLVFFGLHWRLADLAARPAAVNPSFSNSPLSSGGFIGREPCRRSLMQRPVLRLLRLLFWIWFRTRSRRRNPPLWVTAASRQRRWPLICFGLVGGSSDSLPTTGHRPLTCGSTCVWCHRLPPLSVSHILSPPHIVFSEQPRYFSLKHLRWIMNCFYLPLSHAAFPTSPDWFQPRQRRKKP